MEFIIWFCISFIVLEVIATWSAVAWVRGGSALTFGEVWVRQQLLPVFGGLYVGLVAHFT